MVDYNRLILGGTLFGVERWSVGINYRVDSTLTPDGALKSFEDLTDWAQRIRDEKITGQDYTPALLDPLSTQGTIDTVRTEWRNEEGLQQAAQATGAPIVGTSTSVRPPQLAYVVSLITGRPGRSYRGRIYWPAIASPVISNQGVIQASAVVALAERWAEALRQFGERSTAEDLYPVVHSGVKNEVTRVTSVRVGNVIDTQRRRRDAFIESYSEEPIPY